MKNGVMMQVFEWDSPSDGKFYVNLKDMAPKLAALGITQVWMPPACKGTSEWDVGYGSYDYWDLGEYDQKGQVRTKYGTKDELKACIDALHENGIEVLADMVFNHKGGADESEVFMAVQVDENNRNKEISAHRNIEGWTGFTFPGRNNARSEFKWHFQHFSGVDFDQKTGQSGIFRILGPQDSWDEETDSEKGNFDYLMNADIDHRHPDVKAELTRVAHFMIDEMGYDGFRYDALKHISREFIDDLSHDILEKYGDQFYFVGEYWKNSDGTMNWYLEETDYNVDLFDVPLHFNLFQASSDQHFDLRHILDGALVQDHASHAVTFVDNHDSQPKQSLQSWVQPWFKEIAYSLILLRRDGYPCIFWGDYAGLEEDEYGGIGEQLEKMMAARKKYNHGGQDEYFADPKMIGWVRRGNEEFPDKLAVLISTGNMNEMRMFVGEEESGKTYVDLSGKNEPITIDEEGYGMFTVPPGAVTYWASEESTKDE